MIGLGLNIQVNQLSSFFTSLLVRNYIIRVEADGGTVEAVECLQLKSTWSEYNWEYAFRVTDDGGVVESLECVTL